MRLLLLLLCLAQACELGRSDREVLRGEPETITIAGCGAAIKWQFGSEGGVISRITPLDSSKYDQECADRLYPGMILLAIAGESVAGLGQEAIDVMWKRLSGASAELTFLETQSSSNGHPPVLDLKRFRRDLSRFLRDQEEWTNGIINGTITHPVKEPAISYARRPAATLFGSFDS